jgi:predicted O-linked N-acetylglucosamine transferase (SPINDLY family)
LYGRPPSPIAPHANDRSPGRPLRVGYVSPDFRGHPVGRFIEPFLTRHDPAAVEVFCYDEFLRQPDPLMGRLQAKVTNWRNIRGVPDDTVCETIRADKIDILVDLAGHTASNRLAVFARKPAPVQVTYLGYPNTTGVPAIDYLLTDAVVDPPDQPALFTETPYPLPNGFCVFHGRADVPAVAPLPALAAGRLTFGCFHNQAKLNGQVLDLWARVLAEVPTARLLFARHTLTDEAAADLLGQFARRGVGPERLTVRQLRPGGADHWPVYHEVDVSLDPFPWTGHTTSCESLWMGVPTVTLRGKAHAGRMVASVLTHAGLPEWIAETPDEYVRLAVQWANDVPKLAALRAGLRERVRRSKLCDAEAFTRHLENAFRDMWRKWCAGGTR